MQRWENVWVGKKIKDKRKKIKVIWGRNCVSWKKDKRQKEKDKSKRGENLAKGEKGFSQIIGDK
ncbi:MAG: hypothetical protein IPH88_03885 [Bacteroidales bacterium]|nr:hypothetical protein [Bacteroidales bacterium]